MSDPTRLELALQSTAVQRSLLNNTPYYLHGKDLLKARDAGLVICKIWDSRRGVRRMFNSRPNAGPAWHRSREAILTVRRRRNLTIDPLLIGPKMVGIPSPYNPNLMMGWKPSWQGRDTIKVIREVGTAAWEMLTQPPVDEPTEHMNGTTDDL